MRGRVSTTGPPGTARRERMRGRLGIGTEGVDGRWHGPRSLAGGRRGQQRRGFCKRGAADGVRQIPLEPKRRGREDEVRAGGEWPEEERPVLEEQAARRGADDPADLP